MGDKFFIWYIIMVVAVMSIAIGTTYHGIKTIDCEKHKATRVGSINLCGTMAEREEKHHE